MSWFLDKIFGIDEVAQKDAETDAAIAAHNAGLVERGVWSEADYGQFERNQAAGSATNYSGQLQDAFDEGWEEGKAREISLLKGGINTIVGEPLAVLLKSIPWWVWGLALLYLAWTFGLLKRRTA